MKLSTRFQKSIKAPQSAKNILKPGSNNKKLGFNIKSKRWAGSKLYSLTLVERETCPRSCHHWDDCYGNNMPFAHRYSTIGLTEKLEQEIGVLCEKHKGVITIRLHVLGDFFSTEYVTFWETMLVSFPTLTLFGYTGRELNSDIGNAVMLMNMRFPERCVIRFSRNEEAQTQKSIRFAANECFTGASFVCPEQTDKVKSCADCGLCWTTPKTVRFLSH